MKSPELFGRKVAAIGLTFGLAVGVVACGSSENHVETTNRQPIESAYAVDHIVLVGAAKNVKGGINAVNKGPQTYVSREAQHDTVLPKDGAFIIDCVDKKPSKDAVDAPYRFYEQPLLVIEVPALGDTTVTAIAQLQPELAQQVLDGAALTAVAACDKPATQYLPG